MKKTYLILLVVLIVALSGCSSNETTGLEIEELESETTVVESEISEEEIGINVDRERVSGQISKIVGNSLTLELYEMPERGTSAAEETSPEAEKTTSPLTSAVAAPTPGSKGGGGGAGGGAGMTTLEKSGETAKLIIPVGTVIKSSANPDMAFEIENLTQGMNITVFINSELTDKEKATNPDSNIIYASTVNIIESN